METIRVIDKIKKHCAEICASNDISDSTLFELLKFFFCYFLTPTQFALIASELNQQGLPGNCAGYVVAHDTFFNKLLDGCFVDGKWLKPRPLIWDLNFLRDEFGIFLSTYFVTKDAIDYSEAVKNEDGSFTVDWMEEYGFIRAGDVLLTRTIQPVMIDEQTSEPLVLAFPAVSEEVLLSAITNIPCYDGGIALKADFVACPLDINFGDAVGISGVDTVMCYDAVEKLGFTESPYGEIQYGGYPLIADMPPEDDA